MATRSILRRLTIPTLVFLLLSALLPASALAAGADLLIWDSSRPPLPNPVSRAAVGAVGDKMYIIGGTTDYANTAAYLGQTQVFDVTVTSGNPWSTGAALPSPGRWLGASATVGSVIYVLGGKTGPSTTTGSVLAFDTVANTVYSVGTLTVPRSQASACAIGNKIYVVGGLDSNGAFIDDIDTFDTTGCSPIQNGLAQLFLGGASLPWSVRNPLVFTNGNNIYCFSGLGPSGPIKTGWRMDIANTQSGWQAVSPLFVGHGGGTTKSAANGKVYFPAGMNANAATQEYDIGGNSWALTAGLPSTDRRDPYTDVMQGNQLVVIGGWLPTNQQVRGDVDVATIVPASGGSNGNLTSSGGGSVPMSVNGGTVTVTFPNTASQGAVSVSTVSPSSVSGLNISAFQVGPYAAGTMYDISTTITGWGVGNPIIITLPYAGPKLVSNPITIGHWTNGAWSPINTTVGGIPSAKTVTFPATSLSPFSIPAESAVVPASSPWTLVLAGAAGLGLLVFLRKRLAV